MNETIENHTEIHGFDIELNKEALKRIDRLVDHYESSILSHLNEEYLNRTSWSERLADRISNFGGSWKFILLFSVFLVIWMIWNSVSFTRHFDSRPFILLNLILSFIAAFQAPIIMMSQNRQAVRDKHESIIDFAINYKAEQEIDDIQSEIHNLKEEILSLKEWLISEQKVKN